MMMMMAMVVWRERHGILIQMYSSVAKRSRGEDVVETSDRLQGLSRTCGHYCATFCLFVSRGWSVEEFVNFWLYRPAWDQMVMVDIDECLER